MGLLSASIWLPIAFGTLILAVGNDRQAGAVRGFALGTAAHGIGSARALQVNADAGAYAGLGLGIQILLAATGIPLVAWLMA